MPRGRPKKSATQAVDSKPTAASYDCSACTFKSPNMKTSTNHILRVHYGQARINDNTPLSDGERVTGFINAQKLLKLLKCNICEKVFRSGLGYKFHHEICGKDESELYRECEICGKKLKINSLQQHVRSFHMSSSKDEIIDASLMLEQMTAKNKTLSSDTSGRSGKRNSAVRAMENFKELSDDEDQTAQQTGGTTSTKKRLRKAGRNDKDEGDFFEAEEECQLEEEEEDDESDDFQENEDPDDEEDDDEVSENEMDEIETVNICLQDIDNLLLQLKPYIKRKRFKGVENRPFSEELETLEQENSENRLQYKCYNTGCQRFFNYRIDMENHYIKCCCDPFLFVCAVEEFCHFSAKQLSMDIFEHFFGSHRDLIPTENQMAKWMTAQEALASRRERAARSSRLKEGNKKKSFSKKSNAKWKAEYADYENELCWEKYFNYSKEWISYLRLNERSSTYRCLVPLKKHWQMLLCSPAITKSPTIPRYKLTKSMEQSTDNDLKIVAPLQSALNEDSFTFNVGQFVCSAAWAPIPLPTPSADDNEEKPSSTLFKDLLKWSQKLPKSQKRQYLAVATASYFDKIMNIQPMETDAADHPSSTPENSLQLWDMGPLASSIGGNKAETTDSFDWTPKMALNVVHQWGDIAEMAWCPCGSTYEVPICDEGNGGNDQKNSQRMRRLGLLALSCEDGKVRIVSMPHPHQLSNSYDTKVCWSLEPVVVLGGRFQTATSSVTSISWTGKWPQEQLLGGFADGTIALWSLDSLARCSGEGGECCQDHREGRVQKVVVPKKIWCNSRRHPVLTIRWLNPMTFITTQSDSCWLWNLRFDTPCHELQRNVVQKVETHPLWYNTLIVSDSTINKPNSMVIMKTFCSDEIFEGGTMTVSGNVEALRHHTVANMGKIRCNDMSISPWQYLLAFCCENGELFTTSLLPKPFLYSKNIVSHQLYKIRLGDLSFERLEHAQLKGGSGKGLQTEASSTSVKADASSKKPLTKAKGRKMSDLMLKKQNQLINGVVDLAENYDDFFLKYCLIFDDAKKVFFGSGRAYDKSKKATTSPSSSDYLTKNDLVRPYAITTCLWNPNLPAYSWLFTATKTGICRLVSYPLVNPDCNLNC